MSSSKFQFITNKMCPFAQKAWIALEASDLSYEMKEISLYGSGGKPKWFLKLNPAGTVPVLAEQDGSGSEVFPDSELILDYVSQNTNIGDNIDGDTVQRWRKNIAEKIIPIGKRAVLGGSRDDLFNLLEELDGDVEGAFLCGDEISVADCAAFPFIWRINDEFGLDRDSTPRLKEWLDRCTETKPFQTTIQRAWWWWW